MNLFYGGLSNFMAIFNYIGYFLGYILWFFFDLLNNFGLAIILFSITVRLLLFPLTIKQQKSSVANMRLSKKQKELQKKYGNDRQKYNEEFMKMQQEEGINPMGGCLTMFAPMLLLLGVYYSVIRPLQNTLHIAVDKVGSAVSVLNTIPVIGDSFSSFYGEIEIIRLFPYIKNQLTMFSPSEIADISEFSHGFNFLGLDLLATPSASPFSSMLWIIPALCFLSSTITTFFTQRIQKNPAMQGQGCMNISMYIVPLFSVWIAYTVPAAVGFYWIVSTLVTFVQTLITNHFYNVFTINAKDEAQRVEMLKVKESSELQSFDPSRYKESEFINLSKENIVKKNKKKK